MYYRYLPYPYYRRYYNLNPYYYYRRYYPYYNIVDSQIADVDQSIINYGDMIDVIQDADIYQSMAAEPDTKEIVVSAEPETTEISATVVNQSQPTPIKEPPNDQSHPMVSVAN